MTDPQKVVLKAVEATIREMFAGESPCERTRPVVVLFLKSWAGDALHLRRALVELTTDEIHLIAQRLTESQWLCELNRKVKYKPNANTGVFVFTAGSCMCAAKSLLA